MAAELPISVYPKRTKFTIDSMLKSSQTPVVRQWRLSIKKVSKLNPKYLGPVCG